MLTALDLLLTRRSVPPAGLEPPGPDGEVLRSILVAATRVPDHGKLEPWRLILFRGTAREDFGSILADAFAAANPEAEPKQIAFEKHRFLRAPLVIAVVSAPRPHDKIPEWEQRLSAAAVCCNLLHAAHASGFAASWITEWYAYNEGVRGALSLTSDERIAGFVYIGTEQTRPPERPRPRLDKVVHEWTPTKIA